MVSPGLGILTVVELQLKLFEVVRWAMGEIVTSGFGVAGSSSQLAAALPGACGVERNGEGR